MLLDIGVQGLQVTNQSLIYRLDAEVRIRVNSSYMVCYFLGGSIGSALAASVYDSTGWAGFCTAGAGVALMLTIATIADAAFPPHRTLLVPTTPRIRSRLRRPRASSAS